MFKKKETLRFKILDCPVCHRETLMVQTSPLLRTEGQSKDDQRWLYRWFCTSCSKYFDLYTDEGHTFLRVEAVQPSYDGKSIFNPNKVKEN